MGIYELKIGHGSFYRRHFRRVIRRESVVRKSRSGGHEKTGRESKEHKGPYVHGNLQGGVFTTA